VSLLTQLPESPADYYDGRGCRAPDNVADASLFVLWLLWCSTINFGRFFGLPIVLLPCRYLIKLPVSRSALLDMEQHSEKTRWEGVP
jgi:hypothetical protein